MKNNVRILSIELENFKNVDYGKIRLSSAKNKEYNPNYSDILGIYGQNGSGKTSIIEAMQIIKDLLMGKNLNSNVVDKISKLKDSASIKIELAIKMLDIITLVEYQVILSRNIEAIYISKESIKLKTLLDDNNNNYKLEINNDNKNISSKFSPQNKFGALSKEKDIDLIVAHKISSKENKSFIFGEEAFEIFSEKNEFKFSNILTTIKRYAIGNLYVLTVKDTGLINLGLVIPLEFRQTVENGLINGRFLISLLKTSYIKDIELSVLEKIIKNMNIVINEIIPGLNIGIKNYGKELIQNGEEMYRIELTSQRDNVIIPIREESEGIIKIISLLHLLMSVYSNSSTCVFIDEFDSGIYEYLLGEILEIFQDDAKGQLIFTSHNLRALEKLNKDNIIISTTNKDNRFIRFTNVKSNNNLRDMYLRSIIIGGQSEHIYNPTDKIEVSRAFRKVRRLL